MHKERNKKVRGDRPIIVDSVALKTGMCMRMWRSGVVYRGPGVQTLHDLKVEVLATHPPSTEIECELALALAQF